MSVTWAEPYVEHVSRFRMGGVAFVFIGHRMLGKSRWSTMLFPLVYRRLFVLTVPMHLGLIITA